MKTDCALPSVESVRALCAKHGLYGEEADELTQDILLSSVRSGYWCSHRVPSRLISHRRKRSRRERCLNIVILPDPEEALQTADRSVHDIVEILDLIEALSSCLSDTDRRVLRVLLSPPANTGKCRVSTKRDAGVKDVMSVLQCAKRTADLSIKRIRQEFSRLATNQE